MITETSNFFITNLHSLTTALSGGDSMARGLITVGLLGGGAALCRNVPKHIFNYFKRNLVVSVKTEDKWFGNSEAIYEAFGSFISENQVNKEFRIHGENDSENKKFTSQAIHVVPDYTSGFFFYKGLPYYFKSEKASEQGAVPASIEITTLGRSPERVWNAVNLVARMNNRSHLRTYYEAKKAEWASLDVMEKSPAIFLPAETKRLLDERIDLYINSKETCIEKGTVHKLLIIVYGPPGTGKSRISRYVADRLNASLASMTAGSDFVTLMRQAARKNIVVSVPDFDAMDLAASRGKLSDDDDDEDDAPKPKKQESQTDQVLRKFRSSNLSAVLNLFQGDIPVNDLVAVMSTNCIDDIDEALLRPGRCDLLLYIGNLGYPEVNAFIKHHYETTQELSDEYKDISIRACDMTALYETNMTDLDNYLNELRKFI